VHFIDSFISVDLILVPLVGMFDLSDLVIVVEEVAKSGEVGWDLGVFW
jgi:hypothetical protein